MKKTLITSLLLVALAMPFAPIPVKAQTIEAQVADIQTKIAELQKLLQLLQMIEELKAQIANLQTSQVSTNNLLGSIVENTRPAREAPRPMGQVTLSDQICSESNLNGMPRLSVDVTGVDWSYATLESSAYIEQNNAPLLDRARVPFKMRVTPLEPSIQLANYPVDYDFVVKVYAKNGEYEAGSTSRTISITGCKEL